MANSCLSDNKIIILKRLSMSSLLSLCQSYDIYNIKSSIILLRLLAYGAAGEDSLLLVSPLLRFAISRECFLLFVWLGGAHLADEFTTVLSSEARPKKLSE